MRALAAIAAMIFATGCVVPAGIIDDWRPPQAKTPEEQVCGQGTVAEAVPCVVETNASQRPPSRKPSPPRRLR